jgi:N-acylneuraminate cytidylyltransferase
MNIAVITARGGSKRIPRKNIKEFYGKPVIAYAIKAALESEIFNEVFVSTDDEEIAEIAQSFGATVPWLRSKELSDDYATTVVVMQDAVLRLTSSLANLENICCIYPVTPLLKSRFLAQGLEILQNGNWDYVISALRSETQQERLFSLGPANEVQMHFPKQIETLTQNFSITYQDAGQFYWGRKSSWELAKPIFSTTSTIIEMPENFSVDVNTLDDWRRAEHLFESQKSS